MTDAPPLDITPILYTLACVWFLAGLIVMRKLLPDIWEAIKQNMDEDAST